MFVSCGLTFDSLCLLFILIQKPVLPKFNKTIVRYPKAWRRGYNSFSMLNSADHEIVNAHKHAHKYKSIKKCRFLGSDKPRLKFLCSLMS